MPSRQPAKFRILPLLLMVACFSFVLRLGEVVSGAGTLNGGAIAEDKPAETHEATAPAKAKEEVSAAEQKDSGDHKEEPSAKDAKEKAPEKEGGKEKAEAKSGDKAGADPAWPDGGDIDLEFSDVRKALADDLAKRRKALDAREQGLATREAVLKAAEAEIERKYQELAELRSQLQNLLHQQSEEETARLKSLVRIYEGMKPADAARIFNTLDITVLLDVLSQMSERKSAPVLAAMDADRARAITLLMAQQKKLPDLVPLNGAPAN